jgi:hypothetical protein
VVTLRDECTETLNALPSARLGQVVDDLRERLSQMQAILRGTSHERAVAAVGDLREAVEVTARAIECLTHAADVGRRYVATL